MNVFELANYLPHATRASAYDLFLKQGLPTRANESYKYTDFSALKKIDFDFSDLKNDDIELPRRIENTHRLVFINGVFSKRYSDVIDEKGLSISENTNDFKQSDDVFALLNDALFTKGITIDVDENCDIQKPLHLLHVQTQSRRMQNTRYSLHIDKNAKITVFEEYCCPTRIDYFNNVALTIRANEYAQIDYYRLQNESMNAFHVANIAIEQHNGSRVRTYHVNRGARIARHNLQFDLIGNHSHSIAAGLYVPREDQHLDSHLTMNHLAAHAQSEQWYRGVIHDNACAVFNGRIFVDSIAQKTDAYLKNQNLLLGDASQINTKPELEIYADDVKCAHGATVGQLNKDAVFYLQSRGIEKTIAEQMLIDAFLSEFYEQLPASLIKTYLEKNACLM